MAGGGNAIRGSRVGAGPMGEAERGDTAPRQRIVYFCANGHETAVVFAVEAAIPEAWDCPRCGLPTSTDVEQPAAATEDRAVQDAPGLREGAAQRAEAAEILEEALKSLRDKRQRGEVVF